MKAGWRVAAILFFVGACCGCDNDVAAYRVKVHTLWSEETFPKDYPQYPSTPQWSPVFGQSHNTSYALFRVGEPVRPSVREFAQFGKLDGVVDEGDDEAKVYDQFSAPAIKHGVGETEDVVFVDGEHSLVSLMARMIPSPDWFVGVDSLNLCVDSSWVDDVTLDLDPMDAGTASGLTFSSPRWDTAPPEPVFRHKPKHPNHPAAGFYYPLLKELPTIAKVQFTKVKAYSTRDINDLVRKELIQKIQRKDKHIGSPKTKQLYEKSFNEMTTHSPLDELKSLEEEPFGTPAPNLPENNVIVVTRPPYTKTMASEEELDSDLQNMDDVVLAVAQGHRLGLGKHLPRHFRSRLHHAVNRIQPDDCLVSEWGDWTPCSATCGFGERFRSRTVVRARRNTGRDCPALTERRRCGDANSCAYLDDDYE